MSSKGPLPPVDDPLLEATLAKLSSAAGAMSREPSETAPPAAAADPITQAAPADPGAAVPVADELLQASSQAELMPPAVIDAELRDAVGAAPWQRASTPPDRDDPDDSSDDDELGGSAPRRRRRSRTAVLIGAMALVGGVGIAALVLLGRVNATHYYLACEPEQVVARQGRSFPPWGERPLDGSQWSPIKIPPEAECVGRATDDPQQLADWYRAMLVERAGTLLTAGEVTDTAGASALLQQALLHARSDARRSERQDIERLLGDVDYWRASAKLKDAAAALADAAKQFDQAAAQRPRHVSDAAAWAEFVRRVATELESGPTGAKATAGPPAPSGLTGGGTTPRPRAPAGTALPVEDEPSPGAGSAAARPTTATEPTAPDAGVPSSGVLL